MGIVLPDWLLSVLEYEEWAWVIKKVDDYWYIYVINFYDSKIYMTRSNTAQEAFDKWVAEHNEHFKEDAAYIADHLRTD